MFEQGHDIRSCTLKDAWAVAKDLLHFNTGENFAAVLESELVYKAKPLAGT